ncbi:MAG TPA: hypothetical protein DCZ92_01110 [Elusimicrobia bacterium]|nr:MAG: hypothetical protein A2016_04805 [Elusimicrobia bacterium GWF2_62_30]HBA59426.1 hypothetical protein [Elusimicrobiota bacterium]
MKLQTDITINNRIYAKGAEVSWWNIYPLFLVHMLLFGLSGFVMAYSPWHPPLYFIFLHGGLAVAVYTLFYRMFFGVDEVRWMFINAGLGLLGIYTQVGWLLSRFGKKMVDYPFHLHVLPFLYYILYTFLLRQALLDLAGARENEQKRNTVENIYVGCSVAVSIVFYYLGGR